MSSPTNVPGVRPPPGRLGTDTPIETCEGAVPLVAEIVSQFPPSAVIPVKVQSNVPVDPPFLISISWFGGARPFVLRENCACPGRLSKNGRFPGEIVRVTGTVIDWEPSRAVNTICPV